MSKTKKTRRPAPAKNSRAPRRKERALDETEIEVKEALSLNPAEARELTDKVRAMVHNHDSAILRFCRVWQKSKNDTRPTRDVLESAQFTHDAAVWVYSVMQGTGHKLRATIRKEKRVAAREAERKARKIEWTDHMKAKNHPGQKDAVICRCGPDGTEKVFRANGELKHAALGSLADAFPS